MKDPTRKEIEEFLNLNYPLSTEQLSDFNREEAIYCFAYNYHLGQKSNLYSVLSTSEYKPSPLITHIESEGVDGSSQELYDELVKHFTV